MQFERSQSVLNVFGVLNRGGAELRTVQALPLAVEKGVRVDFCCLSGMPGELDGEVSDFGGTVYHLKLDYKFPVRFFRLLRKEHYEVVHSHVHLVSGLILLMAAAAQTPVRIAHFRSTHDGGTRNLARSVRDSFLKILVGAFASRILGVSKGALSCAWSPAWTSDPRCAVVYNGVQSDGPSFPGQGLEKREQYGVSPREPLLIHVGRFTPAKNHAHLIRTLAAMGASREAPKLILLGRYTEQSVAELVRLAEELGVRQKLIIAGEQAGVMSFIDAADLMIFPSLWEGLPGAVLECLSRGLRVLASDIPGICEIRDRVLGVETLPLDADSSVWAGRAWEILDEVAEASPQTRMSTIPRGSVFDLCTSSASLVSEWTGEPQNPRRGRNGSSD